MGSLYSGLLMGAIALLSVLMVSTVRYTSFKTVGLGRRSTRLAVVALAAIGMLVWLYSRYVLVSMVGAYILYGLLARGSTLFRHRPNQR